MSDAPVFFATPAAFAAWLRAHHASASELLVGFYTKDSGKPSMTWPESVAEALCVGWIDGIRRNRDHESYTIRFTPRTPKSTWSAVNVKLAERLVAEGRMQPAGLAAFERRTDAATATYSYEQRKTALLTPTQARRLRANSAARTYFDSQPPGYRHLVAWWINSAKQEATRERRLELLIACSAEGRRVNQSVPDKRSTT